MKNLSTGIVLATLLGGIALAPDSAVAEDRAALMSQHRGGTINAAANAAAGTMDPQINYTLILAALPGNLRRPGCFQERPGRRGLYGGGRPR